MQLKVLGSSSKGNCYLLDNGKECLVIECGIPFKEVQKAVNFDIKRIKGAIVSHEHGDHAKHVEKFIEARIPVWMSDGTRREVIKKFKSPYLSPLIAESMHKFKIGSFTIFPFDTEHDCAEPLGYLINHPECGTVLFATDTYFLKYKFKGLNQIMIECNYRLDIMEKNVESGKLHPALRARTIKSHCSFETCCEILEANDLTKVNNILLIHLSDGNANPVEFERDIRNLTGKAVTVAHPGLVLDFNLSPF